MDLKFGNIYLIPKNLHPDKSIAGHFVVILCVLEDKNEIVYQTLGSRLWRVFPKLNLLFGANSCISCGGNYFTPEDFEYHKKHGYLSPIDIDNVHFLNYKKYSSFLNKETFVSFSDKSGIVKDNLFDISKKIEDGVYPFQVCLADFNKRCLALAFSNSPKIDSDYKEKMLNYYRAG